MKKTSFFVISSLLAAFLALPSWADTVKLKNDGTVTGIIKDEDEASITLEIGAGTMRIAKNDIEAVRKDSEKNNAAISKEFRKNSIERGSFVPPGLEKLARKVREVSAGIKDVEYAKRQRDSIKDEIDAGSRYFKLLRADFEAKSLRIHEMDPASDVTRYNKSITELNMTNTKLSTISEELNSLSLKLPEYQRAYWKAITDYGNGIGDLRLYFDKQVEAAKSRGMTEEESLYFETVKKSLANLEKDLSRDTVSVSNSVHGMTVKATLNGDVTCVLAVDTGAAVVVISKEIADRLEVNPNDSVENVEFALADGSLIKSKVIRIKSIRVGNTAVYDVAVAVTDNPPQPGIDGLLGMSFLNNFNIKMDVANEKLILETIRR